MIGITLLLLVVLHVVLAQTPTRTDGKVGIRPVTKTAPPVNTGPKAGTVRTGVDDDVSYSDDVYGNDDYVSNDDYVTDDYITDDYVTDDYNATDDYAAGDDAYMYDDDIQNNFILFTKGDFGKPRVKWNEVCTAWCKMGTWKPYHNATANVKKYAEKKVNWSVPIDAKTCGKYVWKEFKEFCECK